MLNFRKIDLGDMELILNWRTSDHVTKYMYTDIERNMDNQRNWFIRTDQDQSQAYWMIQHNETPIGLISIHELNWVHRRASLGFYIGDLNYARLAGHVHAYLYNFAFKVLKLNKLIAEVMDGNEGMMNIHLHHGFEHRGTFKEHIYKNGQYYDVHYFELMAETWKEKYTKFHRLTADFPFDKN